MSNLRSCLISDGEGQCLTGTVGCGVTTCIYCKRKFDLWKEGFLWDLE